MKTYTRKPKPVPVYSATGELLCEVSFQCTSKGAAKAAGYPACEFSFRFNAPAGCWIVKGEKPETYWQKKMMN